MPEPASRSLLEPRTQALRPAAAVSMLRAAAPFLGCILLAVLLQLGVKPLLNDFDAKLFLDIGTNVILAVSLTMVNGFTGQFSIGHAAFMAVGAYTAAAIVYYGSFRIYGDPNMHGGLLSSMLSSDMRGSDAAVPLVTGADGLFVLALLAGGLVAAATGYLVGLPSLRLRGDYLAIVTLGFGEIVRVLITTQTTDSLYDAEEIAKTPWYDLAGNVGGALGFSGLPFYTSLFWAWFFAAITLLVAFRLKTSTYGRAFLSIREDEIAAGAMGIHITRYKVRAFVISAFFAGIAGGLFAHTIGVQLNPGELGFMKSFDIIIMVVLGGLGSISGAALAAAILTILPELLRQPPSLVPLWSWFVIPLSAAVWTAATSPRGRRLDGLAIGAAAASLCAAVLIAMQLLSIGTGRLPPILMLPLVEAVLWFGGATAVALVLYRAAWRRRSAVLSLAGVLLGWELVRYLAPIAGISLSDYRMVLYALALIIMMIVRPQGLFGIREIWELRRTRSGPPAAPASPSGTGRAAKVPVS